jgi:hypothetical protein
MIAKAALHIDVVDVRGEDAFVPPPKHRGTKADRIYNLVLELVKEQGAGEACKLLIDAGVTDIFHNVFRVTMYPTGR